MTDDMRVTRFDFSSINQKPQKTRQGFLRVPGQITRTGVLEYKSLTGETRRELRHPSEVFNADSVETLQGVSVTDLHRGMIGPANVQNFEVGNVGETIENDGKWLSASLTIKREDMITAVEKKTRCEISAGYTCILEHVPGEYEGDRYDAVQRDIIYNHVALGPKDWARSGPDAVIKMDSLDVNAAVSGIEEIRTGPSDVQQEKNKMEKKQINLKFDNVSYEPEIAEPLAANFEGAINKLREDGKAAEIRVSELEGELAAEKKSHGELQEKYDAATSPEARDKVVNERLALVEEAKKIAPDIKCDGLSDRAIKIAALKANDWQEDHFDGKDDAYLNGVFAAAVKHPASEKPEDLHLPTPKPREDGKKGKKDKPDSKQARQDMMDEYAWDTKTEKK